MASTANKSMKLAGVGVVYAVMIVVVILATIRARDEALRELASPPAVAGWTQWREDVKAGEVSDDGAVARRTPQSTEQPWLVLMRDHFAICLTAAILFTSLVFAAFVFFILAARQREVNM